MLKIAAYLEEADDDPTSACDILKESGIHYAVLKNVWSDNICDISDNGCGKLKKILASKGITPIAIITRIGEIPANALSTQNPERAFNLAQYFRTPYIRFQIGLKTTKHAYVEIDEWLARITKLSISHDVIPMFEITNDSYITKPTELITILTKHKRWKLLYDPVQFILKQNQDPFVKYWTLLKQFVVAIDVRDLKIGRGYKPPGLGDSKILQTVTDAINSDYHGWFFFEPSLGKRHSTALTKGDTFKLALLAFKQYGEQHGSSKH